MLNYIKSYFFAFLFIIAIYIMAFTGKTAEEPSTIGDVRYSVLDPKKFMALNPGWVLMDGGAATPAQFNSSRLHTELGMEKMPDGRGVFIRGMNEGRKDGDLNRQVGTLQLDMLAKHQHEIKFQLTKEGPQALTLDKIRGGEANNSGFGQTFSEIAGGEETRPKNIALYTYIKIN
jgi:hypothetical protein